jgi:hypothetical protein
MQMIAGCTLGEDERRAIEQRYDLRKTGEADLVRLGESPAFPPGGLIRLLV